jgi:hypothetical protein
MGRLSARVFAVLAVGAGVGLLTWGISAAWMGDPIRVPGFWAIRSCSPPVK